MRILKTILTRLKSSKQRLLTAICVIIFLTAAIVVGASLRTSPKNAQNTNLSQTDTAIAAATKQIAENPKNVAAKIRLCQAYIQKSRETADSTYYNKCDKLLADAEKMEPANVEISATQASIAYARHDFTKGLELSQKALNANPDRPIYYGLVGDGQIELGQYEQAVDSYQAMIDKRPELSSYNRVAYIRELYGDIPGAQVALKSAIDSGSSYTENIAFSQVELGKLLARSNLNDAAKLYEAALNTQKNYAPALDGLGRVAFAKRDYRKAIKYFDQAFAQLPIAQYATSLGDTYTVQGKKDKAAQHYYLADLAFEESSKGGVNNDYEMAVFLTDHNRELPKANDLARKAVANRPNIFSNDILAWNLYKMGNFVEAQTYIQAALALGENVPIVNYHAGMIAEKLGQKDQAKTYLQKAFAADRYFLESHFSLLDNKLATETLNTLRK